MRYLLIMIISLVVSLELSANALKFEESPYLQQHANNPVDWMPWGAKAFNKAKREHKLIFLSIGYSTCHWCHVMEHESFENKEFAKFLNKNFVAIKVDREEKPQIDSYYQKVYQIMNQGGGGWPLTIILTPDRKPIFAGTYIPLEARYGSRGLLDILEQIVALKKQNPKRLEEIVKSVEQTMNRVEHIQFKVTHTKERVLAKRLVNMLAKRFDYTHGGIGIAPKFPQAPTIIALLDIYGATGDKRAFKMAQLMLDHMAKGGIYDQIEGGFYRYSTDASWGIPHFEKMLYTNAELIEAYAKGYRYSKKRLYKRVINQTIAFLNHHYRYNGLYFGASDADSLNSKGKEEEGYYYLFSYKEALQALQRAKIKEPQKILEYFGISWEGNFHNGLSNPSINSSVKANSKELQHALGVLRAVRIKKHYPFIDKKMLTAWNSLLAHALFVANKPKLALSIVDSILKQLYIGGKLYHQKLPQKSPTVSAVCEDYAFFIAALLDSFEYTGKKSYLELAKKLTNDATKLFRRGGIWYNSNRELSLKLDASDDAYRGTLGIIGQDLLRLGVLSADIDYSTRAKKLLAKIKAQVATYPPANATAVDFALSYSYGYIAIKASKESLHELKGVLESKTNYPYFVYEASSDKTLLACRRDRCFAYSKKRNDFIKKVLKEIKRGSK